MEALEEVGFSDYAYVDVLGAYAEGGLEDPVSPQIWNIHPRKAVLTAMWQLITVCTCLH